VLVPELVELRVYGVDLGPHLSIVLVGKPVPELGSLLAQSFDLSMDFFQGSHVGFNGRHAHDIPGESSALTEEDCGAQGSGRGERFAHPVANCGQLELLTGHLAEQLVGRRLLPLRPQLAQQGASLAA